MTYEYFKGLVERRRITEASAEENHKLFLVNFINASDITDLEVRVLFGVLLNCF